MDTSSRIQNCDTTSLLDLKAELYRKQEACKLAKTRQNFGPRKGMTIKGQEITSKKKDKKLLEPETTEIAGENDEDEMLQKSRMILEAKAKIYNQIIEKKVVLDEEFSDNYLVDFQRKELLKHSADVLKSDPKPENVDVSDSDKGHVHHEDQTSPECSLLTNPVSASHQSLDSESQSSHSTQAEKTEATVHQNTDGPVHYQNVRFNEIRDHGVGYFAFSQAEKERKEQMDLLKNLRQETIETKQAGEKLKQKKQALLKSRLAKVCQRRNIDSSVLQAYERKEEIEDMSDGIGLEQRSSSPADQPTSTESASYANLSSKKVRPWDIGKSNFDFPIQVPKKKQSGAEKWIEHKRKERNEEFAPPSFYYNSPEPKTKKFCQDHYKS